MNRRSINTIIVILAIVNLIALIGIAARFEPLLRATVGRSGTPSDVVQTEQELELLRQQGEISNTEAVNLSQCKGLLSDCRRFCQQRYDTEDLSPASVSNCYTQCEQSWRFCAEPPVERGHL